MKKSLLALATTTTFLSLPALALLPTLAFAEETESASETSNFTGFSEVHAQIGGGYHSSFVDKTSSDGENYDATFRNIVFSARLIPQENFAFESNYYYPGAGDFNKGSESGRSVFDVSGLELNALISTSLIDKGFYAYTGVGYFSETWESTSSGNMYVSNGLQVPVGVGYNFGQFSIDAQFALRDKDAYTKDTFDSDTSMNDANTVKFRIFANL